MEAMEKISLFSVHVKVKNILILGEGPTKGLDDTTLTAETKIFYTSRKKICIKSAL